MLRQAIRISAAAVVVTTLVLTTATVTAPRAAAAEDLEDLMERAADATTVLEELMGAPDRDAPEWLLEEAHCVAVIPKVVKAGFILAGRHGKGLVSCRTGNGWSRPAFVSLSGGSFGLQIGAQATDFVLIFANEDAVAELDGDKFTLGGDASVSAGPVGRTAEAGTDVELDSEIYSYSRSKGVFAGVSLEGAEFGIDGDANREVYGDEITPSQLLTSDGAAAPEFLAAFLSALSRYVPGQDVTAG